MSRIKEKYIEKRDDKWHSMDEITPITKDVIFERNGKEIYGTIVVEMCGVFYYSPEVENKWINRDSISRWRFLTIEEIRETIKGLKTK